MVQYRCQYLWRYTVTTYHKTVINCNNNDNSMYLLTTVEVKVNKVKKVQVLSTSFHYHLTLFNIYLT